MNLDCINFESLALRDARNSILRTLSSTGRSFLLASDAPKLATAIIEWFLDFLSLATESLVIWNGLYLTWCAKCSFSRSTKYERTKDPASWLIWWMHLMFILMQKIGSSSLVHLWTSWRNFSKPWILLIFAMDRWWSRSSVSTWSLSISQVCSPKALLPTATISSCSALRNSLNFSMFCESSALPSFVLLMSGKYLNHSRAWSSSMWISSLGTMLSGSNSFPPTYSGSGTTFAFFGLGLVTFAPFFFFGFLTTSSASSASLSSV